MTDRTVAERVKRYRARQKEAGLVLVQVWVPAADQGRLIAYAEKLKAKRVK